MERGKISNMSFAASYEEPLRRIISVELGIEVEDVTRAEQYEDMEQATDWTIKTKSKYGNIAARVRRYVPMYYAERWRDLTIRAWIKGSDETEIDKLRKGHGNYYLYAWVGPGEEITHWIFVDIMKMRMKTDDWPNGLLFEPRDMKYNTDNTTGFYAYALDELEKVNAILNRGGDWSPPKPAKKEYKGPPPKRTDGFFKR